MDLLQSSMAFWVAVAALAVVAAPADRRREDLLMLLWVGLAAFLTAGLWP